MSLIETPPAPSSPALAKTLRLGAAHLTVTALDRSVAWYERSLGLRVHAHDISRAAPGDGIELDGTAIASSGRPASVTTAAPPRWISTPRLVVISGCGHVSNLEQPEQFDEAVREFCHAHPPR